MTAHKEMLDALHALAVYAGRLRRLSLPENVAGPLIDMASLVTMRRQLGENPPAFVGFIGCTGTGKSTLFNSFAGRKISLTGWKVHNTCGPVLLMPDGVLEKLGQWESKFGPLLLPSLKRELHPVEDDQAFASENLKKGSPGTLHIIRQLSGQNASLPGRDTDPFVFIDLPDINSSAALEENLIALDILPWLDIVIFMVDDETLFHQIYRQPVQFADELEQHRFCVLSNRGKDRVDFDHPDIKQAMDFFGVDAIHILPQLKDREFFDSQTAFIEFKQTVETCRERSPQLPLLKKAAGLARLALEENSARQTALKSLEQEISALITTTFAKDAPISLEKILHDDVLQALRHLGLKRFAVSNLLYFFKSVAAGGSLKHGFKLALGDRRDKTLAAQLKFDRQKLVREVLRCLVDYRERILLAVRSHPDIDIVRKAEPFLNRMISSGPETEAELDNSQALNQELQTTIDEFQAKCSQLLASDSISAVVRNDPLVAAFLVAAFVTDVFVVRGFVAWLLVPTAFRYLPLGKFEKLKKEFQYAVQNIIQKQLLLIVQDLQAMRARIVLEDQDTLLQALNVCAQYD